MNRREFLKFAGAAGALPLFNIGCAGFGRLSGLRGGEKARIAIVCCGDWGGTLLRRAGAVGGKRTSSEIANAHQKHAYRKGWEIV